MCKHKRPHAPYRKWFLTDYLRRPNNEAKMLSSNRRQRWLWDELCVFQLDFVQWCNYIQWNISRCDRVSCALGRIWCYRLMSVNNLYAFCLWSTRFAIGKHKHTHTHSQAESNGPRKAVSNRKVFKVQMKVMWWTTMQGTDMEWRSRGRNNIRVFQLHELPLTTVRNNEWTKCYLLFNAFHRAFPPRTLVACSEIDSAPLKHRWAQRRPCTLLACI